MVFISVAAMGRRQENIWLLWRVCLLWNVMVRSIEIHRDQVFKFETDQEHVYRNTGKEKACCTCFFSGLSLMQLYQEFCC